MLKVHEVSTPSPPKLILNAMGNRKAEGSPRKALIDSYRSSSFNLHGKGQLHPPTPLATLPRPKNDWLNKDNINWPIDFEELTTVSAAKHVETLSSAPGTRSKDSLISLSDWLQTGFPAVYCTLSNFWEGSTSHTQLDGENNEIKLEILQNLSIATVGAGGTIIPQYSSVDCLFIIVSGICKKIFVPPLIPKKKQEKRKHFKHSATNNILPEHAKQNPLDLEILKCGDCFGEEEILFKLTHHYSSYISQGCLERDAIGISRPRNMYLLSISKEVYNKYIRKKRENEVFQNAKAIFLQEMYLFKHLSFNQAAFLAYYMDFRKMSKDEYLFTKGQPTCIYIVKSGELRVNLTEDIKVKLDDDNLSAVETREVELKIVGKYDIAGLIEACNQSACFSNSCVTSSIESEVYIMPAFAFLAVMTYDSQFQVLLDFYHTSLEWITQRRFTALNKNNKQEDFSLNYAIQSKSTLKCARCGEQGHSATSKRCKVLLKEQKGNLQSNLPCISKFNRPFEKSANTVANMMYEVANRKGILRKVHQNYRLSSYSSCSLHTSSSSRSINLATALERLDAAMLHAETHKSSICHELPTSNSSRRNTLANALNKL